jgi:hypothetical protein
MSRQFRFLRQDRTLALRFVDQATSSGAGWWFCVDFESF